MTCKLAYNIGYSDGATSLPSLHRYGGYGLLEVNRAAPRQMGRQARLEPRVARWQVVRERVNDERMRSIGRDRPATRHAAMAAPRLHTIRTQEDHEVEQRRHVSPARRGGHGLAARCGRQGAACATGVAREGAARTTASAHASRAAAHQGRRRAGRPTRVALCMLSVVAVSRKGLGNAGLTRARAVITPVVSQEG